MAFVVRSFTAAERVCALLWAYVTSVAELHWGMGGRINYTRSKGNEGRWLSYRECGAINTAHELVSYN
jgi:hypothetical protein